jgi:hypothetical protein
VAVSTSSTQPAAAPAEALEAELERIGEMHIEQLRLCWRTSFATDPPPGFSKDLLARAIGHRLQEQAFGGLSASTDRLLRSLVNSGVEPPRRIKAGSILMREHQGVVHEVLVVPGGFCWQGQTYDSLSTIAKTITGTIWNGPRFFGLRAKPSAGQKGDRITDRLSADGNRTFRPSSSRKASSRSGRRSSVRAGASGDAGGRS